MKNKYVFPCLIVAILSGCGVRDQVLPFSTQTTEPPLSAAGEELFIESGEEDAPSAEPQIARSRLVRVNLDLLLDEAGQAREVREVMINLFPDVIYGGIITGVEPEGDGYAWTGTLEGVEFSQFFMIYTSGVFIGHFASPEGVYEVSFARKNLYRVIKIDQSLLPQVEG